jgi:DNA-binding transcriptional regulator LsrR (DeoR family)
MRIASKRGRRITAQTLFKRAKKMRNDHTYNAIKIMIAGQPFTPQSLAHQLNITDVNARRIINRAAHHNIVQHIKKTGQTNFYQLSAKP